jgi:hypothetical protein
MTLISVLTLPARLAIATTRTTLALGALAAPDGPLERLIAEGGTLDQLVGLGETLEEIRPQLAELAELIPVLAASADALQQAVGPLGDLAGRLPLRARRAAVTP